MDLESYLREIGCCSDEGLTEKFGIYDNWPILLDVGFERFSGFLSLKDFVVVSEVCEQKGRRFVFDYVPGTVRVQVYDYVFDNAPTPRLWSPEDNLRQKRDYQIGVMVHNYQERKIEGISDLRAMADFVGLVGDFALEGGVGLCFPKSIGWENCKDFSKIVYF